MKNAIEILPAESFNMAHGSTFFDHGECSYSVYWTITGSKAQLCKGVQDIKFLPENKVTIIRGTTSGRVSSEHTVSGYLDAEKAKTFALEQINNMQDQAVAV